MSDRASLEAAPEERGGGGQAEEERAELPSPGGLETAGIESCRLLKIQVWRYHGDTLCKGSLVLNPEKASEKTSKNAPLHPGTLNPHCGHSWLFISFLFCQSTAHLYV